MLQKMPIVSKNNSNKSCGQLNFLQKTQWDTLVYLPQSGVRELHMLPYLKYYNILKRESRFTLRLKYRLDEKMIQIEVEN